ncbi:MAG: succinyl-CoA--3-ketoacid-CoA transferase [Phycisphaerae bacterium]|nr:succinyl-CoA--3-ketoacid-CoA transferase [Phycisphaerae bacterium]
MAEKILPDAAACLADLKEKGVIYDGCTVMVGGFGLCGIPEQLIMALRDTGVKGITCVSNNAGVDDWGLGLLLQTRQIRKMISSYVGENAIFERQFIDGELEVEFNPQGTLAERIRAGGAGVPAFFTATGAGTAIAEGKETRVLMPTPAQAKVNEGVFREREFVMETGIYADLALVKAYQSDPFGNLVYRKTARNFNPMMATAAAFTIAEVDELVGLGDLDPDHIHTPGSFVDRVVRTESEKRIEQRTTR